MSLINLFISHSHADKALALDLEDCIVAGIGDAISVWTDLALRPGQSISGEIERALSATHLVVVVWTANTAGSDGVAAELAAARRLGKPVIPCVFDRRAPLVAPLDDVLAIDFTDPDGGLTQLGGVISQCLAAMPGPAVVGSFDDSTVPLDSIIRNALNPAHADRIRGSAGIWASRLKGALAKQAADGEAVLKEIGELTDFATHAAARANGGAGRAELLDLRAQAVANRNRDPELLDQVIRVLDAALG